MNVDIATTIALPPERVWQAVQKPQLLRHIAWPLIRFSPSGAADWPAHFVDGEPVAGRLWLLGFIPFGRQWIVPSLHLPPQGDSPKRLRDNGYSRLIRRWDHWISVEPDGAGGTRYSDTVEVEAGVLTPLIGLFAHLFYRHRQRRWRGLAGRLPIYRLIWNERAAYRAARWKGDDTAAWDALKTVHILAQSYPGPHWSSHIAMLRFGFAQRDWREVGGQFLRLALVPFGNSTGRLPVGNHGRSRVSPFQPMAIDDDLQRKLMAAGSGLSQQVSRDTR